MATRLPANSVRLYHRDTPRTREMYPVVPQERIRRVQAATFPRRVVTGPVSADAEEFIHSWTQDDYSAGFGIKDANESTDTARIEFGIIDARHPRHVCLPPLTETPPNPSWATDPFWPLGDVGTQFYGAWAEGIAGWDVANGAWYTTQNAWPASFQPTNKPVAFCGYLFVPGTGGSNGAVALSELTAATGTLTVTAIPTSQTSPLALGIWDNRLWSIHGNGHLRYLTTNQAVSNPATGWASVTDALGTALVLNTSALPTKLLNWYDSAQEEKLWAITRHQGAYIFNPDEPRWIKSTIKESAHPDWGIAAEVFRDGEDMMIAAGGLDVTRFTTANVEVPLSGPSKDQGVPPRYNGTIVDLCSERSTLYALIKGLPANTFLNWHEDPDGGEAPYVTGTAVPMWLAGWTGTAWCGLWSDEETSGEPTWMVVSMVSTDPAIWWGGTDGIARKQALPPPFFNPAARVELGVYPFAPEGWMQTIRYDGNMSGWDKVASHAFAMMDYATDDTYVDVSYRTDSGQFLTNLLEPSWTLWKRVNRNGRTIMWFDDTDIDPHSGLPRREGLPFQWIQFRFDFVRGALTTASPLWMWHSLHHLTTPQDAASITLKIPTNYERSVYNRDPDEMAETLLGLQRRRGLIYLQTGNPRRAASGDEEKQVFFRGTVTSVNSEFYAGADNNIQEVIVVNFLEIGASDNAHTHQAESAA